MNIEKYTEELITLRHYFHQHPELALQEVETSAYIRKYLEKLGYEIVHCPYRSRQICHMHQ